MSELTVEPSRGESLPNQIDVYVGLRIRLRRTMLRMSLEQLGDALGLTYQQVQKYESGANRVGASRLFEISRVLNVPIIFFIEDMPEGMEATPMSAPRGRTYGLVGAMQPFSKAIDGNLSESETLGLVRAYYGIIDPTIRKQMLDLIKNLASAKEED